MGGKRPNKPSFLGSRGGSPLKRIMRQIPRAVPPTVNRSRKTLVWLLLLGVLMCLGLFQFTSVSGTALAPALPNATRRRRLGMTLLRFVQMNNLRQLLKRNKLHIAIVDVKIANSSESYLCAVPVGCTPGPLGKVPVVQILMREYDPTAADFAQMSGKLKAKYT